MSDTKARREARMEKLQKHNQVLWILLVTAIRALGVGGRLELPNMDVDLGKVKIDIHQTEDKKGTILTLQEAGDDQAKP